MRVTENPETNAELIARIRDPQDREAWQEFVSIYQPLIYRIGRRHGMQDADANNLAQEVLYKVSRKLSESDLPRISGGFRGWLRVVARNAAIDAIRRIRPDAASGGSSIQQKLNKISDVDGSESVLRSELQREAFRWAARRIRSEFTDATWTIFWQTMVENRSCEEVADVLGKSIGSIYTARSRVMQRLKREVETFDWESAELDGGAP